jgi:hypothetical protein
VDYSGGLDVNTDGEYEGVPDWLREAAMAQTALNLATHTMFQTEDNNNDLRPLRDQIARVWGEHVRMKGAAYQPRFTEPSV